MLLPLLVREDEERFFVFSCHQMNRMNLIIFLLPTDSMYNTNFFLSPDEPDEPDGWYNVLSG